MMQTVSSGSLAANAISVSESQQEMLASPASLAAGKAVVHIVCHYDSTNSSGGLDKQARLLTRCLKTGGEPVIVLASTRKMSRAGWSADGEVPIRFFWTYHSPQISGRYFPAAIVWAAQLLAWVCKNRRRIAVIHIHQLRIHAFVAALARKLFGIPIILKSAVGGAGADIRVIGSRKYFGPPGRKFVAKAGDVFVATTASIREDLLRSGVPADRIKVIPNGVRLPNVEQDAAAPAAERVRRCVFLGRLAPDKNPVALARAAAKIANENFIVDFYGAGRLQEKLQAAILESGNPWISYRGFVADPGQILPHYGWLLLPSSGEGLSNAMIEAMAHGVVPVTTRVSGCIDHIEDGTSGFFFSGITLDALGEALTKLTHVSAEQWSAMSNRVASHAFQAFDIGAVAATYRKLYAELSSPMGKLK